MVLEVQGGTNSRVTFSMLTHYQPASAGKFVITTPDDTLLNFSIHSLPLEEQALFQTILRRVLAGACECWLEHIGTFYAVLIALAFIQTTPANGFNRLPADCGCRPDHPVLSFIPQPIAGSEGFGGHHHCHSNHLNFHCYCLSTG